MILAGVDSSNYPGLNKLQEWVCQPKLPLAFVLALAGFLADECRGTQGRQLNSCDAFLVPHVTYWLGLKSRYAFVRIVGSD